MKRFSYGELSYCTSIIVPPSESTQHVKFSKKPQKTETHILKYIYIYIYLYICVCVCVCVYIYMNCALGVYNHVPIS